MGPEVKKVATTVLLIAPALAVYAYFADNLNFTQDDAYISYRYVANYLNGHGLVFNIGERIEGFTNFGWVVYLVFIGTLGANYLLLSKLTGLLLGASFIVVTYLTATRLFRNDGRAWALLPTYLIGVNLSLAYWSPAGLETAAFALLVALSLYLFLKRSWWLVYAMVLLVWMRPDGAMVVGLLILVEGLLKRRLPRFTLSCAAVAFVLSLPFVAFKLLYFGSVLPNPFYAKTAFNFEQVIHGLEYTGTFLSHYGFYGIGFLLPLLFWKKLASEGKSVWLFALLFTMYIVLVGGDVLKVHRFFIPLLGVSALLITLTLRLLLAWFSHKTRLMILFLVSLPLVALTYQLPQQYVRTYHHREMELVHAMQLLASDIKDSDSTQFTAAIGTIGAFSYELLGHDVIDMLGLTDSVIARHPEEPVPGIVFTWREGKYNTRYLLGREPDYIAFSTGIKPSAPAEQTLLLYPQFHHAYNSVGWFYKKDNDPTKGFLNPVFKRMRDIQGELRPAYPVECVQLYKLGLDIFGAGKYTEAIRLFDSAINLSPDQPYKYLPYYKAVCYKAMQQHAKADQLFDEVLQHDSLIYEAHKNLYLYAVMTDRPQKAEIHKRWVQTLTPWYWPTLKKEATELLARVNRDD